MVRAAPGNLEDLARETRAEKKFRHLLNAMGPLKDKADAEPLNLKPGDVKLLRRDEGDGVSAVINKSLEAIPPRYQTQIIQQMDTEFLTAAGQSVFESQGDKSVLTVPGATLTKINGVRLGDFKGGEITDDNYSQSLHF